MATAACTSGWAYSQQKSQAVQVTGVVKSEDRQTIGRVGVIVKHHGVGVLSGNNGVSSIACYRGDTIMLSSMGYVSKEFVVPATLSGNYYSTVQTMVQDTFYMPEVRVIGGPSRGEFDYVMKYGNVPDNPYQIALNSLRPEVLNQLKISMPKVGSENQAYMQRQEAYKATYYGQQAPQGIFNPLKWGEFFQSLKK